MEYFIYEYFGSMTTNDARCTCEIKSSIFMAKAAFNKKKALFVTQLSLNLRKEPVKCCIWSISLYGVGTWTLQQVENTRKVLKLGVGKKNGDQFDRSCEK
jgi:hypothetical protein